MRRDAQRKPVMPNRTPVEKNANPEKSKHATRSNAPKAPTNKAVRTKTVAQPHPANVARSRVAAITRPDIKSPHPATVTASNKPKKNGNGEAKSPHPANQETPRRPSRSTTDGRASSPDTRRAKPSDINHDDYVERIIQLEAGGDERALIQQLSRLDSAELRAIAERFTHSTSWRTAGQVKWLRAEDVEAGTRRVVQVCVQRAAGGLTTKFEIVEIPVDAVLAADWQATDRFGKGRVLGLNVRSVV
jgi:hypothetical protein